MSSSVQLVAVVQHYEGNVVTHHLVDHHNFMVYYDNPQTPGWFPQQPALSVFQSQMQRCDQALLMYCLHTYLSYGLLPQRVQRCFLSSAYLFTCFQCLLTDLHSSF
ncbi:hypothetical protein XENOCAPTIV_022517 [Xenoophorus captivus]|uniref:MHC class II beta antigen n=1 Tax=Xenoophorus captivus TaxID=1517983 RepID=A0ABV0QB75_9TELE